jgi:hypothetical protein
MSAEAIGKGLMVAGAALLAWAGTKAVVEHKKRKRELDQRAFQVRVNFEKALMNLREAVESAPVSKNKPTEIQVVNLTNRIYDRVGDSQRITAEAIRKAQKNSK